MGWLLPVLLIVCAWIGAAVVVLGLLAAVMCLEDWRDGRRERRRRARRPGYIIEPGEKP